MGSKTDALAGAALGTTTSMSKKNTAHFFFWELGFFGVGFIFFGVGSVFFVYLFAQMAVKARIRVVFFKVFWGRGSKGLMATITHQNQVAKRALTG